MARIISVNWAKLAKPVSLTRRIVEFKHAFEKARKEDNNQSIRSFYKDQCRGYSIA